MTMTMTGLDTATEADTEADTEYTVQAGGEGHGAIVLSPPTDRAGGGRK